MKFSVENYRPFSLTSIIMKFMGIIVRDELMAKCSHLIDPRQHGFLQNKSCTTRLVDFCDSLALSLNIRSYVIYFDFAKAFDSVIHDLNLYKLTNLYSIDGFLLIFLKNNPRGRTQSVVIGSFTSRLVELVLQKVERWDR